ncbi:MAG: hypothetical protein ACYDAO_06895 [Thermoplasmataceae archaeon]
MSKIISLRISDDDYNELVKNEIKPSEYAKNDIINLARNFRAQDKRNEIENIIKNEVKESEKDFGWKSVRNDRDSSN